MSTAVDRSVRGSATGSDERSRPACLNTRTLPRRRATSHPSPRHGPAGRPNAVGARGTRAQQFEAYRPRMGVATGRACRRASYRRLRLLEPVSFCDAVVSVFARLVRADAARIRAGSGGTRAAAGLAAGDPGQAPGPLGFRRRVSWSVRALVGDCLTASSEPHASGAGAPVRSVSMCAHTAQSTAAEVNLRRELHSQSEPDGRSAGSSPPSDTQ